MECPNSTELQSWGLSPWLYVKGDFQDRVMFPWIKSQLKVPSTQWLRPSKKMDEKTPVATEVVREGQPKGNTTKSLTGLRLSYHSLFPRHRIIEACCTSDNANQWPEGTVGVRVRPEAEKSYWKI